jgi:hypothetical protein
METSLESERDALIQIVSEDYSRGAMEMPAFELAVTRLNACADRGALEIEANALGLSMPVPRAATQGLSRQVQGEVTEAVELTCVSGNIRNTGDWVKARHYKLALKSSNARLDLREYEGARGFLLEIDVDAISSNVRLIVPKGFEVEERFSERVSSTVRNKPKRGSAGGSNLVILTGYLRSSSVRIKYR